MFSQKKQNHMYRKLKTKEQKKIERLEAKLAKKEAELSQVKKDRKRLNYAVGRLERVLKNHSSKEDKKRIALLEKDLQTANETAEKRYEKLKRAKIVIDEFYKRITRMKEYANRWENTFAKKRLGYFIGGFEEDIDGHRLYDQNTLIANVNILDGHWLDDKTTEKIKDRLKGRDEYKALIERCKPYVEAANNGDIEAMEYLNNQMWLLIRHYYEVIEDDYYETFYTAVSDDTITIE